MSSTDFVSYAPVLIVVIIVIIVVVYFVVTKPSGGSSNNGTNTKRSLADMSTQSLAPIHAVARSIAGRYVLPNVDQGNAAKVATLPVAMGYGGQ